MTKNTSIVLLSIVTVIVLFLGVFSFIPDFEVGEYNVYHSPVGLIQRSNLFTSSVKATYQVELDEEVENFNNASKVISARFRKAYGYYGVSVDYADGVATITVPQTNNDAKTSANSILNRILANGNVEILSDTYGASSSYSPSSVLLTQEHFKHARVQSYLNQSTTLYICKVKLTPDGKKLADSTLSTSTPYICAVDGEISTWVYYTGSELQITFASADVAASKESAKIMASYVNNGPLGATLTADGTEDIERDLGWIYLVVFALIAIASFVFLSVRYKTLGAASSLMQLLAIVVFVIFAGLVHLEMFNLASALGVICAYAFMTFFTVFTLECLRKHNEQKSYSWSRHTAFVETAIVNLIAHAALLVLGVILWVIPSIVTAPLGNVLVYGAVLSFIVTFGLNRVCAWAVAPFYEENKSAKNAKK